MTIFIPVLLKHELLDFSCSPPTDTQEFNTSSIQYINLQDSLDCSLRGKFL